MKLGIVNVSIFLCFLFKKGLSVRVFIVDIPDDDAGTASDTDYVYDDYDQITPTPEFTIPQPLQNEKLFVNENLKAVKKFCKRFGSMYGLDPNVHSCEELLTFKKRIERAGGNKSNVGKTKQSQRKGEHLASDGNTEQDFSQDYVDNYWRSTSDSQSCTIRDIINNKCERNRNARDILKLNLFLDSKSDKDALTQRNGFSQDYADNVWVSRSLKSDPPPCTISDIINNKCEFFLDAFNQLKSSRFSNSKSDRDKAGASTQGKDFSQDYVDHIWGSRSLKNSVPTCTLSDIINNKCKLSLDALNRLKSSQFSDSKSDRDKGTKSAPTQGKDDNPEPIDQTEFKYSEDYIDDFRRIINDLPICSLNDIINNNCRLNLEASDLLKSTKRKAKKPESIYNIKHKSFKNGKKKRKTCTITDIINNKCDFNKDIALNRFSDSKSDRYKRKKSKQIKKINFELTDITGDDLAIYKRDDISAPWRTPTRYMTICTINQIVNNYCNPNLDAQSQHQSNSFTDPASSDELFSNKLLNSISKNPISISRRNNLIQFRPNQFRNELRSTRYSDTDESDAPSESEEKPKKNKPKRFQIVKNKKSKKPKKESSESEITNSNEITKSSEEKIDTIKSSEESENIKPDIENALTDLDEVDTSDSFETGPKKASDKYQYLQGHRVVNPKTGKAVRRASRLQTFLPKRYRWKPEDVHNLGYYWFNGPKGPFPSDNL